MEGGEEKLPFDPVGFLSKALLASERGGRKVGIFIV